MNIAPRVHQYIDRNTREVKTEKLICDRLINLIYCDVRERVPSMFRLLTSKRSSACLGFLNYDIFLKKYLIKPSKLIKTLEIDTSECMDYPDLNTARKIFERKIRYWKTRPIPDNSMSVVSPSDSKLLVGSFAKNSMLMLKEKFFYFEELLGENKTKWHRVFFKGSYAICRLTPEKYHYNHTPVAGKVADIYELSGDYHSCNPGAVITIATPFSKNKRVVTIIDTNVKGGTGVGYVAMIEVAAMMIGDVFQCYSEEGYENPTNVTTGMFLKKGCPKSLFKPGSSVVVLMFQNNRISFSPDILFNMNREDAQSRFSEGFGRTLIETDVNVRSEIATRNYSFRNVNAFKG